MRKLDSVLLIDDNEATNLIHRKVLAKMGCAENIHVCNNGEQGLNFFVELTRQTSGTMKKPELVFLDINMPGMSGWDFIEEYNMLPGEVRNDVVIMMLTTSLNPDDEAKAEKIESISGFLNKPLSTFHLEKVLEKHFI